jgi:hypothetical protein
MRAVARVYKRRVWRLTALCILPVALAMPAIATAATRAQANAKARRAANHYTTTHYGIGGPADGSIWTARCRPSGRSWRCSVRMDGGQCTGSLRLSYRLRPYGHRIGCGE